MTTDTKAGLPPVEQTVESLEDRLPQYLGKVCVNSTGRRGIVVGVTEVDGNKAFAGLGLDGKGNWTSSSPIPIRDGLEFFDACRDRFGGRLDMQGGGELHDALARLDRIESKLIGRR